MVSLCSQKKKSAYFKFLITWVFGARDIFDDQKTFFFLIFFFGFYFAESTHVASEWGCDISLSFEVQNLLIQKLSLMS